MFFFNLFLSQMPTTSVQDQVQARSQEFYSCQPCGWQGPRVICGLSGSALVGKPSIKDEVGPGGDLTCCVTMPTLANNIYTYFLGVAL